MRISRLFPMWCACALAASAGCGFSGSEGMSGDAGSVDATPVERIDFLPAAAPPALEIDWVISTNTRIDSTALTVEPPPPAGVMLVELLQRDGLSGAAVLRLRDLTVTAGVTLSAKGSRPLFLLSERDVAIAGTLDVGGHAHVAGPGGSSAGMGAGAGARSVHLGMSDDSGGGGGSFGTAGAAGGNAGAARSAAGATYAIETRLVGGASGGTAGGCTNPPGAGGGALLLYARRQLRVDGAISAGGGGGAGGLSTNCAPNSGAGAGGGSGGTLWLQTAELGGTGVLAANGGGGGAGGYPTSGGNGADGQASVSVYARAGASTGNNLSGEGGTGSLEVRPAPPVAAVLTGNGGGGGGGLGRIVYRAPGLGGLRTSPAAVPAPVIDAQVAD